MKKILLAIMASCLFAFTAAADLGPPGTVETKITGVSVDDALACNATDLSPEAKEVFRVWADLNVKMLAGTLTEMEHWEGSVLVQTGVCVNLRAGIPGTVVLLDGHVYLVDYCLEGYPCIRVIQTSDGFLEN
ncbi:hypothetical protein LCGC14_1935150 [marine sediment metagenome]|uniref:Uncharacterized protein n=1 Tax=marine sediment metagenome TaxID=412755 RepID=A0A0F9FLY2_9ZZZZ